MIRITAKKDGFRRCGVAHPAAPTEYPDDRFTPEELDRLRAERLLVVEILPDPEGGGKDKEKAGAGKDKKENKDVK